MVGPERLGYGNTIDGMLDGMPVHGRAPYTHNSQENSTISAVQTS